MAGLLAVSCQIDADKHVDRIEASGAQDNVEQDNGSRDNATQVNAPSSTPTFHALGNPELLSKWAPFTKTSDEISVKDSLVYTLSTPLFSDYAGKLRTVWMPDGTQAEYNAHDVFDFPVGTIISKTFYYERGASGVMIPPRLEKHVTYDTASTTLDLENIRLIETRILARRETGWIALPYVWNDLQTDAVLKRAGDIIPMQIQTETGSILEAKYQVPNTNQCKGCHAPNNTTGDILPIGPKPRHLNFSPTYSKGQSQLHLWQARGMLGTVPENKVLPAVFWDDAQADLNDRARAYLDINCAHCHNTAGPADTSGLHLEADSPFGPNFGLCKTPIAAGRGTGNRHFDIVPGDPDQSIFIYRMKSTNPAVMMPELGRSVTHTEGVALIADWIRSLDGQCGT